MQKMFDEINLIFVLEFGVMQTCVNLVDLVKSFRTRIHYLLANIGFDTAENESLQFWRQFHSFIHSPP